MDIAIYIDILDSILFARQLKKICNEMNWTYPNLSTAIGGDEGGVCIGPAIVVMANGDGQWCCCCVCCWWPAVSPLILSGGVSVPGIIPLPTSNRKSKNNM